MLDSVRQPDAFNYIQDLRVIIVAFGITKILQGLGWVVERRRTHGIFWVHTLGAVLVGCLQLQFAWASFYDYRISKWPFGGFLLACATPLIYLFIGYLLFPDSPSEEHDFIKTYSSNIRLIAALAIVAQIVNSLMDYRFHSDEARLGLQHFIRGMSSLVLCGFFLPFPRFRRVHGIVVVVLIVALILSKSLSYTIDTNRMSAMTKSPNDRLQRTALRAAADRSIRRWDRVVSKLKAHKAG